MPLAIDLFCGLGGWSEALLAEGWDVIGFDIEQHVYGEHRYPAQLVLQDVLTLHGSQFRETNLIVASPPCQFFSYTAMPWTRAKALAAEVRADPVRLEKELALFKACFRIQREACAAARRHIPMVVENVRGAIPWVGRSRWNFGSFHLWGDVPALMPPTMVRGHKVSGFRFDGSGRSFQTASVEGTKQGGSGRDWWDKALDERRKNPERTIHIRDGAPHTRHLTNPAEHGVKNPGCDLTDTGFNVASAHQFGHMVEGVKIARSAEDKRQHIGTKRKFASAMIAKIPQPLARHIARTFVS